MLPKINRIRKESDFKKVYGSCKKVVSPSLIFYIHLKNESPSRFAFVASKKFGNAVARNLFKRRLRAIVKDILPDFKVNLDCIIKPNMKELKQTVSFATLKKETESTLKIFCK